MNVLRTSEARPAAPAPAVDSTRSGRTTGRGGSTAASAGASGSPDQVEISPEARARAAEARTGTDPDVETARTALRSESLSDARLHELRERVRTGYYDQPDTLDRIASAAARNLAAGDERTDV